MPVYTLQAPDGKTYDIEGPAGATAEQLGAFVTSQASQQKPAPIGNADNASFLRRMGTGAMDTIVGGAQALSHLPNALLNSINASADPRNTTTQNEHTQGTAQVDRSVQEREAQYQADRAAAGQSGFDGARLVGNVGSSLPLAALPGGGAGLIGRTVASVGGGALAGATTPVTSGDFGNEKAKQIALAAALGGIAPAVASGLSRIVKPQTSQAVQELMAQGVMPTPGQILGPTASKIEEKLTSVPLLGDMISNARGRANDQFNTAAYARALNPLGAKPSGAVGREGVQDVKDVLGNAYDTLLPKLQFKADPQFSSEMKNLHSMIDNGNIPQATADQFNSIVKNEVYSRMTPQGAMDGQAFKDLESVLSQKIKSFAGSPNPGDRDVANALGEVQQAARASLARSNPQAADELSSINKGYANYARIRDAASRQGAQDGVFSPAQLSAAVRAGDKSAGKGNFATGKALMQDLSDAGKSALGSKVPDSGTAGRMLVGGVPLIASAAVNPVIPLVGGLAMLPYTKAGQQMMAAILAKRPELAAPIAKAIKNSAPALGLGTYSAITSGQQ